MSTGSAASDGTLVSIICRCVGRPYLAQALTSLAQQTHDRLEVLLVNANGADLGAWVANQPALPIRELQGTGILSRAEAANTGMAAAGGAFLMFLDDDDWIAPEHVANLLAVLQQDTGIKAAYSATQKAAADGTLLDEFFRRDYEEALLLRDNFLPIHSVLFRRELFDLGCRFDSAFEIYEDWDFWLQVREHTTFQFVDRVTAFYREGGDSGTATRAHSLRYQEGHPLAVARTRLFDKWLGRWSGSDLNRLLGSMDRQQQVDISHLQCLLEDSRDTVDQQEARLVEQQTCIAHLQQGLEETRSTVAEQRVQLANLQEAHRLIEQSLFWRVSAPVRFLRDQLLAWSNTLSATPGAALVATKQAHDENAMAALTAFLDSQRRLTFASTDTIEVSVVLVFYNQAHLSLLCLQSIIEHADVSHETIIVDNHSTDQTSRLLERIDNARIHRNESNAGFVKAVNQAAALARGKHLLLLNNDALLEAGTLSTALATLQSAPDIGAVGARIKLLDGSLQEAGSIIWQDGSCTGYGRGDDPDTFPYRMQRDVDYCSGAFLLIKTALFEQLQGLDEDFAPAYYEESDFCMRLRELGYRTVYEPGAQVTHYEFASSSGPQAASQLQREHREMFCAKHAARLQEQWPNTADNLLQARTAARRPNILVIDDRVPFPSLGAGYPRCARILTILASADVNLSFYPLRFPTDDWQAVYQTLPPTVEVVMGLGEAGLADFLRQRQGFYRRIMVSRVHNMALFNRIVGKCPELLGEAELIYDAEAVAATREILHRRLQGEQIDTGQEHAAIAGELAEAHTARKVVAVSEQEAVLFRQHGIGETQVLGHGLEVSPTDRAFSQRRDLLFVGALRDRSSPNVDSLRWFLTHCFPLIQEQCPGVRLYVVGENSVPSLNAIASRVGGEQIVFTGRLLCVTHLYNACRLFIAPTRFAAGIPHKVHEAASRGLPCVTTSLLAGQLGWTQERELLYADDPADFAAQCVRLHADEALWNRLRQASLAAVASDCAPSRFETGLLQLFDLASGRHDKTLTAAGTQVGQALQETKGVFHPG